MKSLGTLFIAVALLAQPAFAISAGSIKASDCTVAKTPAQEVLIPRTVKGTVASGQEAVNGFEAIIKNPAHDKLTQSYDALGAIVIKASVTVHQDRKVDSKYPQEGCDRTATLKNACVEDTEAKTTKCAQVCEYNYNCIDNR